MLVKKKLSLVDSRFYSVYFVYLFIEFLPNFSFKVRPDQRYSVSALCCRQGYVCGKDCKERETTTQAFDLVCYSSCWSNYLLGLKCK